MFNISNEKLVLTGHIIVLIIIFLVGFGMMFNVISYERNTINEFNSSEINNSNTIEIEKNFMDIEDYNNLPLLIKELCPYSEGNECIEFNSYSLAVENNDIFLCTYSGKYKNACLLEVEKSDIEFDLISNICFQNFESGSEEEIECINDYINNNILNSDFICESEDIFLCYDLYLIDYYTINNDFCNEFLTQEHKNDCNKYFNENIESSSFCSIEFFTDYFIGICLNERLAN